MAFDRGVRARTVTLEGDSFEPQGTLTGGSKSQLGVILGRLAELQSASRELGMHEERLRGIADKIGRLSAASEKVLYDTAICMIRYSCDVHTCMLLAASKKVWLCSI